MERHWGGDAYTGYCGPTSNDRTWDGITYDTVANGYRLPTEAEWEWAARGGENYKFSGSDEIKDVAWYMENTMNGTEAREVKTKKSNGYGLYDMSGNVMEWCWDWELSSTADTGVVYGYSRVNRGGNGRCLASDCAVSTQNGSQQSSRYSGVGFRVVRTAE